MSQSQPTNQQPTNQQPTSAETKESGKIHPICESAPDQEKCAQFVDRLDEATNNIDPHQT